MLRSIKSFDMDMLNLSSSFTKDQGELIIPFDEVSDADNSASEQMEINQNAEESSENIGIQTGDKWDKDYAPSETRKNVIKLFNSGLSAEQIAKTLKLSRGEVELLLEIEQYEKSKGVYRCKKNL